jgi:elongation factor P
MLSMNDLRQGATIVENGDPWVVVESDFMKKAQRRPVMRTKIRNLRTGQVIHKTYKQGDSVPEADVTKVKAQFLYGGSGQYTFMDQSSYEQFTLSGEQAGEGAKFLREGMEVDLVTFEGTPVTVQLPIKVEVKVITAAPGIRGDSASNIMKEATLEGGIRVQVPLFIKEGDAIRIDTRTGEYVERAGG